MSAYCRAEPARIGTILPALALAVLAGGPAARAFRTADSSDETHPAMKVLRREAESDGVRIITNAHRIPFGAAVIYAQALRDPAPAALIERVRRVE